MYWIRNNNKSDNDYDGGGGNDDDDDLNLSLDTYFMSDSQFKIESRDHSTMKMEIISRKLL